MRPILSKFLCHIAEGHKREIETERQRDRETERQRDRETERQRNRETERQRGRETERQSQMGKHLFTSNTCFQIVEKRYRRKSILKNCNKMK